MDSIERSSERIARKEDELVSRHIAGETIVVPIRGRLADLQQIYVLNPVAEFIWERLDGQKSLGEILQDVVDAFDVERGKAEDDVQAFVTELTAAGLVRKVAHDAVS